MSGVALFKGLYDRGVSNTTPASPYDTIGAIKGQFVTLNASELMPSGPGDTILGSAGDTKIQAAITWVTNNWPAGDRAVGLRIFFGTGAPNWMKDTDPGAAVLPNSNGQAAQACVYEVTSGAGGNIPAFWTQTFRQKAKLFMDKVAAAYDGNPAIRLIVVSQPMCSFAEAMTRAILDSSGTYPNVTGPSAASLMMANWDVTTDKACFAGFIYDMAAAWAQTVVSFSFSPYQSMGANEPARSIVTQSATQITPTVSPGWTASRFQSGSVFVFGNSGYLTNDPSGGTNPQDSNAKFVTGTRPVQARTSGSGGTVTYTATRLTDSSKTFTATMIGRTITAGASTGVVTSLGTSTQLNCSGGWSSGTPSAGQAYTIPGDNWLTVGSLVNTTTNVPVCYEITAVGSETSLTVASAITAPTGSGTINSKFNHTTSLIGGQYFIGHPALPTAAPFTLAVTNNSASVITVTGLPSAHSIEDHYLCAQQPLTTSRSSIGDLDAMDAVMVVHQAILGARGLVSNNSFSDLKPMPPLAGLDRDLLTPPGPPNHYQMATAAVTVTALNNMLGITNPYQSASSFELPDAGSYGLTQAQAIAYRQQIESLPNQ